MIHEQDIDWMGEKEKDDTLRKLIKQNHILKIGLLDVRNEVEALLSAMDGSSQEAIALGKAIDIADDSIIKAGVEK